MDALRADHLGCYGYRRRTSPHIDALAKEGIVFEKCYTSSTWTRPVAASILTGTYPGVHLVRTRSDTLSKKLYCLPEMLSDNGYKTAAFNTIGNLAREFGFDRGFDNYYELFRDPRILSRRNQLSITESGLIHLNGNEAISLPWAEDINEILIPWLLDHKCADTFSFIWSIETHIPYIAPPEFRIFSGNSQLPPNAGTYDYIGRASESERDQIINMYDDVIFYNDHCVGNVVEKLKKMDIFDETLLIITSDHGDAFYEHDVYAHGHTPYEELVHVPLIMKLPGAHLDGLQVSELVELIDIFPTIANFLGISLTDENNFIQGQDMLSGIGEKVFEKPQYVFSDTQMIDFHNRYFSIRDNRWKYIKIQKPSRDEKNLLETIRYIKKRGLFSKILKYPLHYLRNYFHRSNELLFDLNIDPKETLNVIDKNPDVANRLRTDLAKWQRQNDQLAEKVAYTRVDGISDEEDEILRKHLEKLGYL